MIQITHITGPEGAPTLVLIPGGPGLSSWTLRSLDLLARSFSLAYVDFPGCNGIPYERDQSFQELTDDLWKTISKIEGDLIVLGHSFGGFFAARLALDYPVAGLICISSPFSADSYGSAVDRYGMAKSPELQRAEDTLDHETTDQNLARWLSEYGELYFHKNSSERGREMLLRDPCSHLLFFRHQREVHRMGPLLDRLAYRKGLKLFLSETTGMISTERLRADAERGGFEFHAVKDASHFVMFDQPEEVAWLIEKTLATENRRRE